jgi:iron complex outermembrane receptor protein
MSTALELRAGLRYTQDKKDFSVGACENSGFVPCVLSGKCNLAQLAAQEPDGNLSANPKDNKLSWDLSGSYALSKDVNVFARVATSFRGSSVQGASASDDKAVGKGFELELQALLGSHLVATLGLGYNDTRVKDPNLAVAVCAACTVTDPRTAAGLALIDGNALPQAPKVTTNFTLRYCVPVGSGDFYAFTDWAYRSKVNFFLYESTEFTGKALLEGGVRVGYTWGNGKYDAAADVRNITNQVRVVGGIDFNNLTGFINEPRSFGVAFKAMF